MGKPSEGAGGAALPEGDRFPSPPRAPELAAGEARRLSGKQARPADSDSPIVTVSGPVPRRSGPSPAGAVEFRAEEAPSYDKRLTPVVPASWPESEPVEPHSEPAVAVTPSQRAISISLNPPAGAEPVFWDTAPKYSVPPASFSEPPLPQPSRRRAVITKVLFTGIVGIVIALLYYEASIAYHVPWQDPRLLIDRIRSR
jgi:hypothetical protein